MDILNVLLEISIYSGIIYAVIMLFKKVFGRKMSPRLHYGIWILLIVRLMMPFTIDSGVSLIQIPYSSAQTETQAIPSDTPTENIVQQNGSNQPGINSQAPQSAAPQPAPSLAPDQSGHPETNINTFSLSDLLILIWVSGMCVCLGYILVSYLLLKKRIRLGAHPVSGHLKMLFEECRHELGVRANIKIIGLFNLATPALFFPRTILMPVESLVALDDAQIKFAIRHELVHYKRKDHLVSVLLSVLQAVYWFNPFVWLSIRQIRSDMEVACDNAVVKYLDPSEKSGYAQLILTMIARKAQGQRVLGMAQGDTKKTAEKRIRGIYMNGSSRPSAKLVSIVIAVVLLVGCFTTACQPVTAQPSASSMDTGIQQQQYAQPSATAQKTPTVLETAAVPLSPTTGLPGSGEYRPVMVQIDNEATGRPQYGIQAADIVYETMIEGADTRFTAIFNDTLPTKIGPVRESMVYHQLIQNEWDAIYIHQGGPWSMGREMKTYHYNTDIYVDGNGGDMKVRIDSTQRTDDEIMWHQPRAQGILYANAQAALDTYDYPRTKRNPMLQFDANEDYSKYPSVSKINIPFISGLDHVEYRYDKAGGNFVRYFYGEPFIDAGTQKAVEVKNIIVQYVKYEVLMDQKGVASVEMVGSGRAEYFVDGRHMTGTWEKTGRHEGTVYKLNDGTNLVLRPGNTWIEAQPDSKNVVTTNTDGTQYPSNVEDS